MHSRPTSRSGIRVSLRREGSLAQASSFRLGESSKREQWRCRALSLRRDLLAWVRWTLAQIEAHRLSDSSCSTWEEFLILSLRRAPLAWARISDPPLFTQASTKIQPEQMHSSSSYHFKYHAHFKNTKQTQKQAKIYLKRRDPSFPYLERASQMTLILKWMSTTAPRADLRAKNLNTDGARDYYKEP